jgi:3-hydroxyisobutyrate dehydrogenase-like beta-hydroxyacid dehydrogenase
METEMKLKTPQCIDSLDPRHREVVDGVLGAILTLESVKAVILGGSLAGSLPKADGDVDLWVFVANPSGAAAILKQTILCIPGTEYVLDAGHVPWFGRLLTVLAFPGCMFGIDIGLATEDDAQQINTGPGAIVLWSDPQAESFLALALERRSFRRTPLNRAERVLDNLRKLKKAVDRGENWGALEYVARARREVLGLIRDGNHLSADWYERPDREVAAYLSSEQAQTLTSTHTSIESEDLLAAGRALARLTLRLAGDSLNSQMKGLLIQVSLCLANADTATFPRLGLIGAGKMGGQIARHFLDMGLPLYVTEPDAIRADQVRALGGKVVPIGALWQHCEVVLCALPAPSLVEEVVSELVCAGAFSKVFVVLSTIPPTLARSLGRQCADAGHGFLDASMSGGIWGARDGTLTLMVGGSKANLVRARPVLSVFAKRIIHVGGLGCGSAAKLIHNMIGEIEVQAFAEGLCVGSRIGLDAGRLFACLAGGMAASQVLTKLYAEGVLGGDAVNVTIDAAELDQRMLLETACKLGIDLTWTPAVHERLCLLQAQGLGGNDVSTTLRLFEKKHGTEVDLDWRRDNAKIGQ